MKFINDERDNHHLFNRPPNLLGESDAGVYIGHFDNSKRKGHTVCPRSLGSFCIEKVMT